MGLEYSVGISKFMVKVLSRSIPLGVLVTVFLAPLATTAKDFVAFTDFLVDKLGRAVPTNEVVSIAIAAIFLVKWEDLETRCER